MNEYQSSRKPGDSRAGKRIEELLKRGKKHLQSLIENVSDIIAILEADGTIRYASPSTKRVLGYEPEELVGKSAFDLVHPKDQPRVLGRFKRELSVAGVRPPAEFRARHKQEGTWCVLEAVANNLLSDPNIGGVVITARDITERKRSEQAIARARDFYLKLLEDFPACIWRSGPDAKCDYFNKSWLDFTGRTLEQELGDGWSEGVHPDDLERCLETYLTAFKARAPFQMEYRLRRHDGQYRWIIDHGRPFTDLDGNFAGYIGSCYDITERKQWEEIVRRHHLLSENARDIVLFVGSDGGIREANRAAVEAYGYTREELLCLKLEDLRAPETLPLLAQQLEQARRQGALFETIHRRKDGSTFPVEVGAKAAEIDGESVLLNIVRDISERKNLQEQFLQAQKMEAVGRLAGGVAHDFNNLLTVINGYCELVLSRLGSDDPLRKEVIEIKRAGEQAADLTQQLLAFSRRQILRLEVIDLNSVVQDIEKLLRRLIGEDIRLVAALDPKLRPVRADRAQIGQVIMNLAINSRDAMPQGGRLTIETSNVYLDEDYSRRHVGVQPGPYVMLGISDTGCGMDAKTRSAIFEPFFTTKEKGKGTGLGLSTAYGIVRQSNGHIWVYSEPGRGTTFKIYLPRVEEIPEAAEETSVPASRDRRTETVLLVEDEEQLRDLAREILQQQGYTVLEAHSGSEALSQAREHTGPIHLLLTDVVMPGMNGRELAERLAETHPETKVLYISGYTANAVVHHGVLDAGTFFLMKPFTPERLLVKVNEVLGEAPSTPLPPESS